jgi:ribonuclease Y
MFSTQFFIYLFLSFIAAFGFLFIIYKWIQASILKEAQYEAQEITKEAQDICNLEDAERRERTEEIQLEMWSRVEESHLAIEEKCTDLDDQIQSQKKIYEEKDKLGRQALMQNETELRTLSIGLNETKLKIEEIQKKLFNSQLNYQAALIEKTQLKPEDVTDQIKQKLINDVQADVEKMIEASESEVKDFAEAKAKRILSLCIDRFSKEMSTERNISSTYFPDEKIRSLFCARLEENILVLQEITGCDILIDKNPDPDRLFNIQVVGYDPVRRELTRRIFEKIFRDTVKSNKPTDPTYIRRVSETLKADLLRQIKKDGEHLAKELGFQDLHPEIKQVMGSLRFRYSYTQNQYFHCGEVGWFAGLLAAELGVNIIKSRRAGLLHDLGKALDHEFDGSHAVIGADFIASRNEEADVIHAVRAHHYDVQPSDEMDFLVIAADAISGGRPGARRSTMETYTQKVTGLQEISKRFHGVTDVFILNGGRECRVHVNSRQVDDMNALKIAEQISKTIEEEMQYPGQIKVVVVRETIVSESRQTEPRNYNKDRNHR